MTIFASLIYNKYCMKYRSLFSVSFLLFSVLLSAQRADWVAGYADGCTSITVGKAATIDGSVITSHTDDSHRTRSWMDVVPARMHESNATSTMYKSVACDSFAMPTYSHLPIGEIPQIEETYQFLNTAYPSMNQYQLGIGESTFGGREELQSDAGLIDCQRLCRLMLERCKTAREAIELAGELTGMARGKGDEEMIHYELRRAEKKDHEFLYDLHLRTLKPHVEKIWGWDEADQRERFEMGFDRSEVNVVVVDGRDVGVLSLMYPGDALYLLTIGIDPASQGRGLGTAILRDVIADAHGRGLPVRGGAGRFPWLPG